MEVNARNRASNAGVAALCRGAHHNNEWVVDLIEDLLFVLDVLNLQAPSEHG